MKKLGFTWTKCDHFTRKRVDFSEKKKDQIQERELGKGVLWHSETSLLQHSDNDLRLISQEEVEKKLGFKLILCFRVVKGFLFSFKSSYKLAVLSFINFTTHSCEDIIVKILSYFVLTELTFTLFKVFNIKANRINLWCEVGHIHLPEKYSSNTL